MGLDEEIAKQRAADAASNEAMAELRRANERAVEEGRRLAREFVTKVRSMGIEPTEFTNTVHGKIKRGFRRMPSERAIRASIKDVSVVRGWSVCYGLIVSVDGRFWKHNIGAHSGPYDLRPDENVVEYFSGGPTYGKLIDVLARYFANRTA